MATDWDARARAIFVGQPDVTDDEQEFRRWYADYSKKLGLDPNPDSPRHFYDYRAAHAAGAEPDAAGHMPSEFKLEGHPNRFVEGMDTKTGQPLQQADVERNTRTRFEVLHSAARPAPKRDWDATAKAIFAGDMSALKPPVPEPTLQQMGAIPQEAVDTTETGMESVAKRLTAGALRIPRAAQTTARMLGAPVEMPAPLPSYLEPQGEKGIPRQIGEAAVESAPQLLPAIGLRLLPGVGLGAQYLFSFSMEGADAYEQSRKEGLSESEAKTVGITSGLINAGLESVFPGSVAKSVGGVSRKALVRSLGKAALRVTKGMTEEGATEFAQTYVPALIRAFTTGGLDAVKAAATDPNTFLEGVISAGAGAVSAGPLAVGAEVAGARRAQAPAAEAQPPAAPPTPPVSPEIDPLARENAALRKIAAEDTLPTVEELAAKEAKKAPPAPAAPPPAKPAPAAAAPAPEEPAHRADVLLGQALAGMGYNTEAEAQADDALEEARARAIKLAKGNESVIAVLRGEEAPATTPAPPKVEAPKEEVIPSGQEEAPKEAAPDDVPEVEAEPESAPGELEPGRWLGKESVLPPAPDQAMSDSLGRGGYQVMIQAKDDPARLPRPKGGQKDKQPHLTLKKLTPEAAREAVLGYFQQNTDPATLNRIGVTLMDKTADITGGSPLEEALWNLVEDGTLRFHVADRNGIIRFAPVESEPAPHRPPAKPVPEPSHAAAPEGATPFSRRVFRGSGRTGNVSPTGRVVYTDSDATPVLGPGTYYAFSRKDAEFYGPNVEEADIQLKNPLIIDSDEKWRDLTDEAGWEFVNPTGLSAERKRAEIGKLQQIIKERGHDGVVVEFDPAWHGDVMPDGRGIKTLRNVFSSPQVVRFATPEGATPAEPEVPPPGPRAIPAAKPDRGPTVRGDKEETVALARGGDVTYRWVLKDARDVLNSFDEGFPEEAQPRERGSRIASEAQIERIASEPDISQVGRSATASDGAPFIAADRVIEAGTGRDEGFRRAYARGTKEKRGGDLRESVFELARSVGLEPDTSIEQPMLFRERVGPTTGTIPVAGQEITRAELARRMNEGSVARYSAAEQARIDADRLKPDALEAIRTTEDGELSIDRSLDFVRRFVAELPESERGDMMDEAGHLSNQGAARIERAIMARAYKDSRLLNQVFESRENNVRTVGRALLRAAPTVVRMLHDIDQGRVFPQFDITQRLADAAVKLSDLRTEGRRLIDYMAQTPLGGRELDPFTDEILGIFGGHAQTQARHQMLGADKSAKKLGDVLVRYVELVGAEPDPRQGGMFGGAKAADPQDLFHRAMADVAAGKQPELFGEQPSPTERGSLVLRRGAPQPSAEAAAPTTRFEGHEEEIERAKEGVIGPPLLRQVLDAITNIGHAMSREQIHLPRTAQNARVLEVFRRISNSPSVSTERVARRLRRALGTLSAPQYDLFLDKMVLDNARVILENYPEGTELPFHLTRQEIEARGPGIDADVAKSERVGAAIADIRAFWNEVRDELEPARKALKLDSDFLHKQGDAYFHHQILEYAEAARQGLSAGMRAPEGRPYMRRLRGSEKAINLHYGQAQGHVLAQMLMDAETARGLVEIRDSEDVEEKAKAMRAKARAQNEEAFYEKINADRQPGEARIERGDDEDPLHPFRIRVAKANGKIARLSVGITLKDGTELRLPEAPGELADVEEALREAYEEFQALVADMDPEEKKLAGGFQFDHPLWFRYLSWLASQGPAPGSGAAADVFKAITERRAVLAATLGARFINDRSTRALAKLAGPDYAYYQPRKGSQFFLGQTIADKLVQKILDEGAAEVTDEDLKEVMIRGGEREGWILRKEIVQALEAHGQHTSDQALAPLSDLSRAATQFWKQWVLISPFRLVRYMARNEVSDTVRAFAGNPSGIAKLPRAWREITAYLNGKTQELPADFRTFLALGGLSGTQFETELDEHQRRLLLRTETALGRREAYDLATGKRWMRWARGKVNLFEGLNRYAQYLDYLEQLRSPEGLKNYGASIPSMIEMLPDNETKAYWLSNELLGAYDQVSKMGQFMRRHVMPFWAFQELNNRLHYRMLKNIGSSATPEARRAARAMAVRRLGARAAAAPLSLALHAGAFLLRAALFEALLWSWNHLRFPELEKELPASVKARTHIITGRRKDGTIGYFDRLSVFEEFRDFFGIDEFGAGVLDYLNGKVGAVDAAMTLLTHPLDKILNMIGPISAFGLKTVFEVTTRQQLFPAPASKGPRVIEDMPDYLAQIAGVEGPFRAITKRPTRPGAWARDLYSYDADPGAGAYYDSRSDRFRFQRSRGEGGRGTFWSPRTTALHYYKRARLLGDTESAAKWLQLYVERGGTSKGLKLSFASMNPLYGLDATEKDAFREWLDEAGRERLDDAIEYYHSVIRPDELPDLPPKLGKE